MILSMMNEEKLQDHSYRKAVLAYVKKKYHTKEDYPFKRDEVSAVLRHEDNKKWYGLLMDVEGAKLGLPMEGSVSMINVKISDQMFHDILVQQEGYFPAYHMNKRAWITILLDGTVPFEEICNMIDASYEATVSPKKKRKSNSPANLHIPRT